ncbi:F-box/LRR-repeat protein 18 [Trichomycterus rosablanca]|uniref:F-box/LRR-repeat protein 18 n=1 Tax=Trichomycterus rosablanca TaxID=2290929 RepID=UPI002F351D08
MGNRIETAQCSPDCAPEFSVTISNFSDEVLLYILSYVPVLDLAFSVSRVCRRLQVLSQDRSLISHVRLHKQYKASAEAVKCLLRKLSSDIQTLDVRGCYWLPGSTMHHVTKHCTRLVRLDVSGCVVPPARLSRLLHSLSSLRSLALDITTGHEMRHLTDEGKQTLAQLVELKQTLLVASYGLVPCCAALQSLTLHLEVAEGWDEPSRYLQLMVGQSSVPRYHNLHWFAAHLAPGEVNRALLNLYLAAFGMRTPERMSGLVIAMPGPSPPMPGAVATVMNTALKAGSAISALQLPRTWLESNTLRRVLAHGCPAYLNLARCATPSFEPLCVMLGANCDLSPLRSLNLRGKGEEEVAAEGIGTLSELCPRLTHFNLSSTHYHHTSPEKLDGHLCAALGNFSHLRSLALPACALARGPPAQPDSPALETKLSSESLLLGLKKSRRVGVPVYQPVPDSPGCRKEGQNDNETDACMRPLLNGCPHLVELELIGTGFLSAMPRNEPAMRKDPPVCPWSWQVEDAHLAALGELRFLRRLTLAHLPGVLRGTGLVQLVQGCKELRVLSLANIGSLKTVNYTQALLEALGHCTQLREFRLEQPYFSMNATFFEALGHCRLLQRLCLVSRHGTFQHAAAASFMQRCENVVMFHMFTGDTLVACETLRKALLINFSESRIALSVVVYPLLHEELGKEIRQNPLCLLDEITLFKSRVAEEPRMQSERR